jgi:hypothetical protein
VIVAGVNNDDDDVYLVKLGVLVYVYVVGVERVVAYYHIVLLLVERQCLHGANYMVQRRIKAYF